MPVEIVMPRLSDTMETGTIARWLKKEGDEVKKGETLADVETDKATMPLESYATGKLAKLLLAEGQSAPIGTPIAVIATAGETLPAAKAKPAPATPPAKKAANKPSATGAEAQQVPSAAKSPVPAPDEPAEAESDATANASPARSADKSSIPAAAEPEAASVSEPEGVVRASPIARRMAEELGIDLRAVNGSGPSGRVTREDVEAAARQATAAASTTTPGTGPAKQPVGATTDRPLSRIQQTIARRMVQSKTTVPHFYVSAEIDMAGATSLRTQLIAAWPEVHVTFLDLIVKAVALALEANPAVNASWREDHLEYHEDVNVGLAVAIEGGLLVPVLHGVNRTDLRALSKLSKDLVQRTREGKSIPGDFEGGTFSVSNLGSFPVQNFLAIVNPPESGILAVSRIENRPVARGDSIVLSDRMNVSLSGDHRVFYGYQAAEFITKLKDLLERPLSLLS